MAFIRFPVASRGALEVCGGVNRIRGQAGSEGGRDLRVGGIRGWEGSEGRRDPRAGGIRGWEGSEGRREPSDAPSSTGDTRCSERLQGDRKGQGHMLESDGMGWGKKGHSDCLQAARL